MSTTLPDRLVVPTRGDLVAQWKSDVNFRAPAINTDVGTLPDIDANVEADIVLPIFVEDSRQADVESLDGQDSSQLDRTCTDMGIPTKLPATGSSGFVACSLSAGGAFIAAGQEIRDLVTGLRWTCADQLASTRRHQQPRSRSSESRHGPDRRTSPRGPCSRGASPPPGLLAQASVFENSPTGAGLSGGADVESDDEQRTRIRNARANPAVSGNDAAYQTRGACRHAGVAIGVAFTYPRRASARAPRASPFLLRPSSPGAGRIPNTAQIALVRANVIGQMSKDDSCVVRRRPRRIRWTSSSASCGRRALRRGPMARAAWPTSAAGNTYEYTDRRRVTDSTHFVISTTDPSPVVAAGGADARALRARATSSRRLTRSSSESVSLSVTGSGPWTIVVDTSNNASDTTFTPRVGDRAMPWSDSLGHPRHADRDVLRRPRVRRAVLVASSTAAIARSETRRTRRRGRAR
jgi:hypothetical protein